MTEDVLNFATFILALLFITLTVPSVLRTCHSQQLRNETVSPACFLIGSRR